jgi:two-component system OmpR family sensor kinase
MASLRTRLLVSVLAITAAGLLLLAGLTYFGQRSFLLDRLDDQISHAPPAAADALGSGGGGPRPGAPRGPGGGGGGGPGSGLPPGTYVEHREADGTVDDAQVFDYGQDITADPALPADMPVGKAFTVDGKNGDDNRYRVYAEPDRFGSGVTVVAAPLTEIQATLNRLLALEALVIAGVLVLLGFVAWAVVRVGLLPLDRIGHTAGAIAGGDLSHRVESVDPRTEVGRLGIALNAMLDRLEGAFTQRQASEDRLRRFLADASHELRTPLASIRGYAELFRMGAARSPEDVEKAMRRIEDEAARMGVLVEDLLTLARLDEIAEAPHTSVDVVALAGDAVDDARAVAPERSIGLSSGVGGRAVVLGDAHQLRQVFANLLRNALMHTPAGTPIEVGVGVTNGSVRVDVRDHGPGLPDTDPAALFERFWRAEGGRERGKAGAGLGLAIVAAIVDAHGGTVSAADAPDGGAVFSVALPSRSSDVAGTGRD